MSWDSEWGLLGLLGEWVFEREISGKGTMSGRARFEAEGEGRAIYQEAGELLLAGGGRLHGEQRYFFEGISDGFAIYFYDDGRLFERVCLGASDQGVWQAEASHVCDADLYVSSYRFGPADRFEIRHDIRGPRKCYEIRTVYSRDGTARK